jgi:6-phosphogluconolactonase
MNGTIQQVGDVPAAFAALLAERLGASNSDSRSLFLSGGETAADCYRALAEATATGRLEGTPVVDWPATEIYLGDERCVPPTSPDSNHRMIADTLLSAIGPVRADLPMYESGDPDTAATSYQRVVEALPHFDVVHLGLGPDAHTASLFPESGALDIDDPDTLVAANADPLGTNPFDRITLTYPGIARAQLVVFTVTGKEKAEAFRRVQAGEDVPAARVTAEEIIWLIDADVAG